MEPNALGVDDEPNADVVPGVVPNALFPNALPPELAF